MPDGAPPNDPLKEPVDDPLNRDAFYSSPDDDEDDGDEYELEPVDPEIEASARRRAREDVRLAETKLQIDEVTEQRDAREDLDEFLEGFKFQFQVKHLLMGTAALAVFLSMVKLIGSGVAALVLVAFFGLIAANAYLGWRDKQREAALAAKRQRLVEMSRAGEPATMYDEPLDDEEDALFDKAREERPPLKFNFSVKEVLIAMTAASVVLGLLSAVGFGTGMGFGAVAAVLGLLAIAGLAAFAMGVELPPMLALGWWVVLLLYIAVSIAGTFFGGD